MKGQSIVKRYARALAETAEAEGKIHEIKEDMLIIDRILNEVDGTRKFCLSVHRNPEIEMEFIRTAFTPYVSEYTGRMLMILAGNRRLEAVPYLKKAVEEIIDRKEGTVRAVLETASEMDEGVLGQIKARLSERTGKEIILKTETVPSLLGGFRITWDNRMIDRSVRGRLNSLRRMLK